MSNKQKSRSDLRGNVHWVAPLPLIVTFSANTAIGPQYFAVTPQTEATFYYGIDSENSFTVPALYTIPLPVTGEMKFTGDIKCIVF